MENDKKERPRNCGECKIYFRDPDNPGRGWCDNWGGVHLHDEDVCRPNRGIKKAAGRAQEGVRRLETEEVDMTKRDIPEPLRKWLGHEFSSGFCAGDDYLEFQEAYRRWLRKALKGYSVKMNKNHYEFSAVITKKGGNGKPDRHVYLSIGDVRFFPLGWYSKVLVRTMKHAEDWTGGTNTYCAIGYIPRRVDELMAEMDGRAVA